MKEEIPNKNIVVFSLVVLAISVLYLAYKFVS